MNSIYFMAFMVCASVDVDYNLSASKFESYPLKADTVPRDIPLDKRGQPYRNYKNKPRIEKLMGLPSLENGFDSLQIRIWYGYSLKDSGQLVILTNPGNNKWSALLTTFTYHLDANRDSLLAISQDTLRKSPRSGWKFFIGQMFKEKFTEFPDMNKIKNYNLGADEDAVLFEISTAKKYRIISFAEPKSHMSKIKQAAVIEKILILIEKEFAFKRLRGL